MKKKIFFSTLIFVAVLGVTTFLKLEFVRAAVTDTTGWLWGGSEESEDRTINGNETGVGWISLNGSDAGAGGGYLVNIPISGALTDYAWSSNLGWIDFNPQNHCGVDYVAKSCNIPTDAYPAIDYSAGKGGVFRTGNSLAGWARFVGIANESANNNSGGLDGWIALGIGNDYDVSINVATGEMSGYGWSELGAVNFQGKAVVEPTVTLTPAYTPIDVATATLPQTVTLTWSSTGADSCNVSSTPTGTWNDDSILTAGTYDVSVPIGMNETFTVTCTRPGGTKSATALISTVCYPLGCEAQSCVNNTSKPKLGVSNTDVCVPLDTCKIDGDCQKRDMSEWSEVTP